MWCRRETWAANTRSTFVVPNQLLSQKSLSVSFTIDVEKLLFRMKAFVMAVSMRKKMYL